MADAGCGCGQMDQPTFADLEYQGKKGKTAGSRS